MRLTTYTFKFIVIINWIDYFNSRYMAQLHTWMCSIQDRNSVIHYAACKRYVNVVGILQKLSKWIYLIKIEIMKALSVQIHLMFIKQRTNKFLGQGIQFAENLFSRFNIREIGVIDFIYQLEMHSQQTFLTLSTPSMCSLACLSILTFVEEKQPCYKQF